MVESGFIKFQVEETKLAMSISTANAVGILGTELFQIHK